MLYSEKRHDISDLVLRGIARTRKISAPNKRAEARSRLNDFEEDQEDPADDQPTDALLERKERAKQAQDVREKTAEEKRVEQLKLREERKKAYEERRTKLLEERENKKKAREGNNQEVVKDSIN